MQSYKFTHTKVGSSSMKQKMFDERVIDFVVHGMKPFSVVDDDSFVNLFKFDPDIKVMSRRTLMRQISTRTKEDREETVSLLASVKYAATMTDIWSTKHHGFLGVSGHWLDHDFKRHSRVLACPHFKNPHSGDRIAKKLGKVHDTYGLRGENLVASTTDNAKNMIKAFEDFGVKLIPDPDESEAEESSDDESDEESNVHEAGLETDEADVQVEDENDMIEVELPAHQRYFLLYKSLP